MIYDLAKEVALELAEQGCPYRVVYGPDRFTDVSAADTHIVFSRIGSSELVVANTSFKQNPKLRAIRRIGATVRVIASSTLPGALQEDHERLADQILDLLIIAIKKVTAVWRVEFNAVSGQFLDAESAYLPGLETWPGVVYDLQIQIDRGVFDRTWQGEARPETTDYTFAHSGTCAPLHE